MTRGRVGVNAGTHKPDVTMMNLQLMHHAHSKGLYRVQRMSVVFLLILLDVNPVRARCITGEACNDLAWSCLIGVVGFLGFLGVWWW